MTVYPVKALSDNIIWIIVDDTQTHCLLIDMGQAGPCVAFLKERNLIPEAILLTHHHFDHTQDVAAFKTYYPQVKVVGSPRLEMPPIDSPITHNQTIHFPQTGFDINTLQTPGHTQDAICYFNDTMVFTGDTLFAAGCGRLFEGTPDQMHQSLSDICSLPENTAVYCGHEYTASNLAFALHIDPEHLETQKWAKSLKNQTCTLPSSIAQEKKCNPFIRANDPHYAQLVSQLAGSPVQPGSACLGYLRSMKDHF